MAKKGKSDILNDTQFAELLQQISDHRHPKKNTLIMQICFKMGLKVHEIAHLKVGDVAKLNNKFPGGYLLNKVLVLKNGTTSDYEHVKKKNAQKNRRSVRFTIDEFEKVIKKVTELSRKGMDVNPELFYPEPIPKIPKARELPIDDDELKNALSDYLSIRFSQNNTLSEDDPLIISQKGGAYSANTLQEHMAMMLKDWTKIDHATSHSGRRTLANKLLNEQREKLSTVQQVLGHLVSSTTAIYEDPIESDEIKKALKEAHKSNRK